MFRLLDGGARGCQRRLGFSDLLACPADQGGIDLLSGDLFAFPADRKGLFVQPVGPVLRLRQKLRGCLGAGIGFGGGLGGAVGLGFSDPDGIGGGDGGGLRGGGALIVAVIGLSQCGFFRGQPLIGCGGISLQLIGVRQILPKLADPPLGFAKGHASGLLLSGDLLLGDAMAFQDGAGIRFNFPQRRQSGSRFGGVGAGGGRGIGCDGDGDFSVVQGGRSLGADLLHAGALQRQQFRLGRPDRTGYVAVAAGLAGLALQVAELAFELGAQVLGAGQIRLGRAQFQLRLVAARVQTGDIGGFFQNRAAFLRPGTDQSADAALADHGGGARTRRQIGEQGLHVPGPGLPAVDAVGGAAAALDPAADFQFGCSWNGGGARPCGFIEEQRHLGDISRRPAGGAGEDDVLHLAAAQATGAAFAHRPAQRFDDIGLAAPVGSDDAGQSGQNLQRLSVRRSS